MGDILSGLNTFLCDSHVQPKKLTCASINILSLCSKSFCPSREFRIIYTKTKSFKTFLAIFQYFNAQTGKYKIEKLKMQKQRNRKVEKCRNREIVKYKDRENEKYKNTHIILKCHVYFLYISTQHFSIFLFFTFCISLFYHLMFFVFLTPRSRTAGLIVLLPPLTRVSIISSLSKKETIKNCIHRKHVCHATPFYSLVLVTIIFKYQIKILILLVHLKCCPIPA